jgi:hypothetical protein
MLLAKITNLLLLAILTLSTVTTYASGSIMNGKPLDPKEFACGNKEADAIECISYQGGQILTGAILTKAVGLVSKNFKPGTTNKVSTVTKSIDDLKKVGNYVDDVDNIKIKKVTSTKVNIDGGEYLFDGEFYYKDGKTFLRVLDPDGSLSAAKGKMVEVKNITFNKDNLNHEYDGHASDWGITANRNNPNLEIFKQKLTDHINKPYIQVINGTYRGQPAIFYYEPGTNLTVFTYPNGQLWGAWKFSGDQANYLKTTGNVN